MHGLHALYFIFKQSSALYLLSTQISHKFDIKSVIVFMVGSSIESLFSSERHYKLFPVVTPSSDVTELKLKTLCFCFCLRLRLVSGKFKIKIWAGNSKFVFAF